MAPPTQITSTTSGLVDFACDPVHKPWPHLHEHWTDSENYLHIFFPRLTSWKSCPAKSRKAAFSHIGSDFTTALWPTIYWFNISECYATNICCTKFGSSQTIDSPFRIAHNTMKWRQHHVASLYFQIKPCRLYSPNDFLYVLCRFAHWIDAHGFVSITVLVVM